jgi:hypothetical protein
MTKGSDMGEKGNKKARQPKPPQTKKPCGNRIVASKQGMHHYGISPSSRMPGYLVVLPIVRSHDPDQRQRLLSNGSRLGECLGRGACRIGGQAANLSLGRDVT